MDLSLNNPTSKLHSPRCNEVCSPRKCNDRVMSIVHHNLESSRCPSKINSDQEILWDFKLKRTVIRSSRLAGVLEIGEPPGRCDTINESKKEML